MEIKPDMTGLIEKPKEIPFESHANAFDPTKELNDLVNEFKSNPKGPVEEGFDLRDILGSTLITDDILKDLGREDKLLQKAKANIAKSLFNDALKDLEELLQINRDHHEAIYLKALCFVNLSKELEALEVLKYFVTNKPHFDLQNNINSLLGKIRNQVIVQIMILSLLNLNEGLTQKLDSLIQLDDGYEPYYFIQSMIYSNQGILDEALNSVQAGLKKIPGDQAVRLLNMKEILEKQILEKILVNPIRYIKQGKYKFAQAALQQADKRYQGARLFILIWNYAVKLDKASGFFRKKTPLEIPIDGSIPDRYLVQSEIIKEEVNAAVPFIMRKMYNQALPYLDRAELFVLRYPFLHYLRAYCVYHQYLVDFLSFKFSNNIEEAIAEIDKCKNDAEIAQEDRTIAEAKPLLDEIRLMRKLLEDVYEQVKQMRKEAEKVNALIISFTDIMKEGTAIRDKAHLQVIRAELQRIKKESENEIKAVKSPESIRYLNQLIEATSRNIEALVPIEEDFESQENDKKFIQNQSEIFNSFVDDINKGRIKVTSRWSCDKYIEDIDNNIKIIVYIKDNGIKNEAAKPVLDQIISNWLSLRMQFEDLKGKI